MKSSDRIGKFLQRRFYPVLVILFLVFLLTVVSTATFSASLLSLLLVFSIIAMFMGQVLLLTPLSAAYPFYIISFFYAIFISMMFWYVNNILYSDFSIALYLGLIILVIAVPLAAHWFTRKRIKNISMFPIFSFFFAGSLIVFSSSPTISITSQNTLFHVTIILFSVTSVFGFNIAYRNMLLNKELKIRDGNEYLRRSKDDLLEKYTNSDDRADIDLLIYYLSSSLDSFVEGDFERSFMDAYKIVFDLSGKAFKNIYQLPENKERQKHFSEIRHHLSHAHISEGKKENKNEEKRDLQKLKEIKKSLFRETLDILKIVRFEYIETALKTRSQAKT